MNPPNNIQNGFFTPVSPFFSKIRKLTVFSHNPHIPIIPQSVRLRMGRGRVIRAENPPFMPFSRRPACSARPEFSGNKKNHMPDARGACRTYDWGFGSIFPRSPRPPSSREGDRPQAVEGVNAGGGRRSSPSFLCRTSFYFPMRSRHTRHKKHMKHKSRFS